MQRVEDWALATFDRQVVLTPDGAILRVGSKCLDCLVRSLSEENLSNYRQPSKLETKALNMQNICSPKVIIHRGNYVVTTELNKKSQLDLGTVTKVDAYSLFSEFREIWSGCLTWRRTSQR